MPPLLEQRLRLLLDPASRIHRMASLLLLLLLLLLLRGLEFLRHLLLEPCLLVGSRHRRPILLAPCLWRGHWILEEQLLPYLMLRSLHHIRGVHGLQLFNGPLATRIQRINNMPSR